MKTYRLSWFDMYGAHRAGKSYAHIARVSGCSPNVARYRVRNFQWSERFWHQHVTLSRLIRHKGYRSVEGSWQVHDYVFHQESERYCDRCRSARSVVRRALLAGLWHGLTRGVSFGAAAGALGGGALSSSAADSPPSPFVRPRTVSARAEVDAMDWPTNLDPIEALDWPSEIPTPQPPTSEDKFVAHAKEKMGDRFDEKKARATYRKRYNG
jgi:hypothetical protein